MTYGTKIREARKAAKLTQEELANACGWATITIGQYERGTREPRLEQLRMIAKALNVDWMELVEEDAAATLIKENIKEKLGKISSEMEHKPVNLNNVEENKAIGSKAPKPIKISYSANTVREPATPEEAQETIHRVSESLSEFLKEISRFFYQLNEAGRVEVLKRAEECSRLDEYKREKNNE